LEPANRYEDTTPRVTPYPYPAAATDGSASDTIPTFPDYTEQQTKTNWGNAARELVETVLLTLVIFFMIRFAIENYRIEGYSMEPNFHDGQFLLVNKIQYLLAPPQRGDVIIFRYPLNPKKNFIKRVIGLPGETVEIRAGKVFVDGERINEEYPFNFADYDYGPITVGEDEYFVLGDNRPESSDSHSWGLLPTKDLIGKAWVSYWPPDEWGVVPHFSYAADE